MPRAPAYFVCTVEAMPLDRRVDFLAVDEIQLAADRERGHVFTDRLLHARGLEETMFLGAETIKPLLRQLVPEAAFIARDRGSPPSPTPGAQEARPPAAAHRDRRLLAGRPLRGGGARAPRDGGRRRRVRRALAAHAQRAGRAVPGGRGGLPRRHRRHRHGAEPRHRPRGLHRAREVRRPRRRGRCARRRSRRSRAAPGATRATAPSARPLDLGAVRRPTSWRRSRGITSRRSSASSGATRTSTSPRPAALLASLERRPPSPELVAHARGGRPPRAGRPRRAIRRCAGRARHAGGGAPALGGGPGAGLPQRHDGGAHAAARPDLPAPALARRDACPRTGSRPRSPPSTAPTATSRRCSRASRTSAPGPTSPTARPGWPIPAHWQQRTRAVEDRLSDTLHERLTEQFVERGAVRRRALRSGGAVVEVAEDGEVRVQGLRRRPPARASLRARREPARDAAACARSPTARCAPTCGERVRALRRGAGRARSRLGAEGQILWRGAPVGAPRRRRRRRSRRASSRCRPTSSTPRCASASAAASPRGWTPSCARGCPAGARGRGRRSRRPCAGSSSRWRAGLGTVARREVSSQLAALTPADRRSCRAAGSAWAGSRSSRRPSCARRRCGCARCCGRCIAQAGSVPLLGGAPSVRVRSARAARRSMSPAGTCRRDRARCARIAPSASRRRRDAETARDGRWPCRSWPRWRAVRRRKWSRSWPRSVSSEIAAACFASALAAPRPGGTDDRS